MDHPCHKCGQLVEDGVPFCAHCGAPQIRVILPEPAPVSAGEAAVAVTESPAAQLSTSAPAPTLPIQWSQALRPCALAALISTLLMGLGLYPAVAMFSAGILAVAFHRHSNPATVVDGRSGARVGAVSGLLWFGMAGVLAVALVTILGKGPELRSEMIKRIQETVPRANDPQTLAFLDYVRSPTGFTILIVFAILFTLVASIALASLGGALAGVLLGRRDRR
jgi:hypothetical protein